MSEPTQIVVRFTVPGRHAWPEAPPSRVYLAASHRHLFYVEVSLAVTHEDREVEFHDLLDDARDAWPVAAGGDLGRRSCETIAGEIADTLMGRYGERPMQVSVFEDGEVGAVVSRSAP